MNGWMDACLFYPDYQIASNKEVHFPSHAAVVLNPVDPELWIIPLFPHRAHLCHQFRVLCHRCGFCLQLNSGTTTQKSIHQTTSETSSCFQNSPSNWSARSSKHTRMSSGEADVWSRWQAETALCQDSVCCEMKCTDAVLCCWCRDHLNVNIFATCNLRQSLMFNSAARDLCC